MNDGPWVRFFASDWLAGTRGMTAAETGIYITLVAMMYERGGPLRNEPGRLARLCGASNSSFQKSLEALVGEGKIIVEGGYLSNIRVVEELSYSREKSDLARQAAESRWGQKGNKNNGRHHADAMRPQCNGNANQNQTQNKERTPHRPPDGGRVDEAIFERFWTAYPRRDGANPRKPARDRFRSACKSGADPEAIIAGAVSYRQHCEARGIAGTPYVAQATTWLNQQRWSDDYGDPNSRAGKEHDEYLRILAE